MPPTSWRAQTGSSASRHEPAALLLRPGHPARACSAWSAGPAGSCGGSRRCSTGRSWTTYRLPMTIVVPVYQEDPRIFAAAIESWLANDVEEVILVIDASDKLCQEIARRYPVTVLITDVPGKRDALRRGWRRARTDLVALVDSDTIWAPDVATEVCKPFADPRIGGVGTRQSVYGGQRVPGPDHRHVPRPPLLRRERQPDATWAGPSPASPGGPPSTGASSCWRSRTTSWTRRSGACPACPATTSG